MKDDDKIESFFKGMKEVDEHLIVPSFPERHESAKRKMLPVFMYAAAGIAAVLVAVIFLVRPVDTSQEGEIFIILGEGDLSTNSLLEYKTLSEWESPTEFLAEDF